MRIYAAEHFDDDQVCDSEFKVGHAVHTTGWGIGPEYTHSGMARGAYVWDAPVKSMADIDRIQTPTATHDPDATQRNLEFYQELLGDILNVACTASTGGLWGSSTSGRSCGASRKRTWT